MDKSKKENVTQIQGRSAGLARLSWGRQVVHVDRGAEHRLVITCTGFRSLILFFCLCQPIPISLPSQLLLDF